MSFRRTDDMEALLEQLGSLYITNKTSDEITERSDKAMSIAPVPVTTNTNEQAIILKNMVPDPG